MKGDNMKIVAILDRSAGNETVGEAWQETKVFDEITCARDIIAWAAKRTNTTAPRDFRGRLSLAVAQEDNN